MKKLLSMLLALSLMVSMLAIGAVATDDANPTITSELQSTTPSLKSQPASLLR